MQELLKMRSSGEPVLLDNGAGAAVRCERRPAWQACLQHPELSLAHPLPLTASADECAFQLQFACRILGLPAPDFSQGVAEERRKLIEESTRVFLKQHGLTR